MSSSKKILISIIIALISVAASLFFWSKNSSSAPRIALDTMYTGQLQHPAHTIYINGNYVASELFSNQILLSPNPFFIESYEVLSQNNDDQPVILSPHYMDAIDEEQILISEGWGHGIVKVNIVTGKIERFVGPNEGFLHAPHGICYDSNNGWIYVADSLNSRLLRYKFQDTSSIEIFQDNQKTIAYGRQVVCDSGNVWMTNSYENRENLNPGQGSNVLKISNFYSGDVEIIAEFPDVNLTGLAVLQNRWVIVGLWGQKNKLLMIDTQNHGKHFSIDGPAQIPGPPYGLYYDDIRKKLLVTYVGAIHDRSHPGGLAIFSINL